MARGFKPSMERLEGLKQKLSYLKTVREKKAVDQIKGAHSFDGLPGNSEYDKAKNEQGKFYSRIAEAGNTLADCMVIEEHETDPNSVRLGPKVRMLDLEFEEEESCQVIGSQEAGPTNGRALEDSPFDKVLLGNAVDDEAQVEASADVLRYRILRVQG